MRITLFAIKSLVYVTYQCFVVDLTAFCCSQFVPVLHSVLPQDECQLGVLPLYICSCVWESV